MHLYAEVQIPGKRMEFMNHEDKVTFTINQVAKILGVVPATIRNWEKNRDDLLQAFGQQLPDLYAR